MEGKRKGQENLIPVTQRSEDEVREMRKRGGINSGETRRKKKMLTEAINIALMQKAEGKDATNLAEVAAASVLTAQRTDEKGTAERKLIAELNGEYKQVTQSEHTINATAAMEELMGKIEK